MIGDDRQFALPYDHRVPAGRGDVYLDHSASAPVAAVAALAVSAWLTRHGGGNPSSQHLHGQRARAALDRARAQLADALGLDTDGWVFCSGATEGNALALRGAAEALQRRGAQPGTVAVAAIEHPSLLHPADALEATGWNRLVLATDDQGRIDVEAAAAVLASAPRPWLVAVAAVHHELGVIQPIAALAAALQRAAVEVDAAKAPVASVAATRGPRIARSRPPSAATTPEAELHLHVDASQAVGRVPAALWSDGATTVVVSAHKFGGLAGCGALWLRPGRWIDGQQRGGQERGLRGGTENLVGAIAMGAAASETAARLAAAPALRALRDRLWTSIAALWSGARRNGPENAGDETGHLLSVAFPGVDADVLVAALDLEGVATSAGAACSSGTATPSPAIAALAGAAVARRTVRFSLGPGVDDAAIDRAVEALRTISERLGVPQSPGRP